MGEVLVHRRQRTLFGKHGAAGGPGLVAGSRTFDALAFAFRGITQRRRVKKLLARAGAVAPLNTVSEGVVRVKGRVEILEAVSDRGQGPVAAFAWRGADDGVCGCGADCTAMVRVVETRMAAGRFLVRDQSGVALVTGPWIRLLDDLGGDLNAESGGLYVREGDAITVLGEVRLDTVDEPRARMTDGYRGVRKTPVFLGEESTPLYVFCEPET